jgi:hypothetical protein
MSAGLIFPTGSALASQWQFTAGPTVAAHGEKWVVGAADDLTLPAGPVDGDWVQIAPDNLDWDTTTSNLVTTDTSTIGVGQAGIPSEAEAVTLVYETATDNWKILAAGVGFTFQAVNTVAGLPPAASVIVGTQFVVVNDGVPANNGTWSAVGANVGLSAVIWILG